MPNENERLEKISKLLNEQGISEGDQSAISDFIKRIQKLEDENSKLRSTIKQDIELIAKTEDIVKKAIIDKQNLEKGIIEKDKELQRKNAEISLLKIESTMPLPDKPTPPSARPTPPTGPTQNDLLVNQSLIDDLKEQLEYKKQQISEFQKLIANNESRIEELEKVNKSITTKTVSKGNVPTGSSGSQLATLVQDLQSEINRYKTTINRLKTENSELKETIKQGGATLENQIIEQLMIENESLKSELEDKDQLKGKKGKKDKLKELYQKIAEKDHMIERLVKLTEKDDIELSGQQTTPVSGLVEELQNKISKLTLTLKEKENIISSLRGN